MQRAPYFFPCDFYKAERCHIDERSLDGILRQTVFELMQQFLRVLFALLINKIYKDDPGQIAEPDLAANNAFWDRYEGPVSDTAERINDTYLRANGQADGVRSYDRMVDLIMAYFTDFIES